MNEKTKGISLSIQEKNGNAVSSTREFRTKKETIQGTLTSRIETKHKDNETYYYGFFKLETHEQETPVIFKKDKPNLSKGTQVELEGIWAKSNGERPSFTCLEWKVLAGPPQPTLQSLQKEISFLLKPSLDQKKNWSETTDFLFKKQKELSEIKAIIKLGEHFLKAYLLTRQVFYANYQVEHLEQANFTTLETYLERMLSELEITKKQMLASGWKEVR